MISKSHFNIDTAGFVSPNSVQTGDAVNAFVTCPKGDFTLTAYRMGYYGGAGATAVWFSKSIPCMKQSAQSVDPITHLSESRWKLSTQIPTNGFSPGVYLLKISSTSSHEAFMLFVIRQSSANGHVVFAIPTMTNLAYNTWNGANAYRGKTGFDDRARVLSFDRPNDWGYGSGKYLNYIHPLLVLADQLGLNIDYVTDVDVATIPNLLDGARAYVSPGHDEYWTGEERSAVEKARDSGTNLLFFGANVAYWQTRLASSSLGPNRHMIIYKSATEDPNKTNPTIRSRYLGRPESALTGLKYNCYPATGIFKVSTPRAFMFQGITVAKGAQFPGIIGPEVDHLESPTHFVGKTQVVANTPVTCGNKIKRSTSSIMIYGVSPSGAGTISVGTMRWVERGLTRGVPIQTQNFVTQVTKNILIAAARGPLGMKYPL